MTGNRQVFLLSPAHCGGKRAGFLLRPQASFDLALRLRSSEGATIGDIFAFMSGLYFRGKLAYSRKFANPPATCGGIHVIVPGLGLLPPDHRVDLTGLEEIAKVPVDPAEPRYLTPLQRDLEQLDGQLGAGDTVILLGSVATPKYLRPLSQIVGERLRYPKDFVGLGDMSRGSIMLRCAAEGRELSYIGLANAGESAA